MGIVVTGITIEEFTVEVLPNSKYASVTSVDVERSFSQIADRTNRREP